MAQPPTPVVSQRARYSSGEQGVILWFDDRALLVRQDGDTTPRLWWRESLEWVDAAPAPSSLAGGEDVQKRVERIVFEDFYGSPVAGSKERLAKALILEFGLAALSPEAPAREGVERALHLKLVDTLKPFAEVAERLKHCHVVEICEPSPDNPSRNIIPMPREWFERAADDLEAIAIQLHGDGVLSEGQAAKLTGLDRVEVRKQADALTPRHEAPASEVE